MKDIPVKLKYYVLAVLLIGLMVLIYMVSSIELASISWGALLLFVVLTGVADSLPVRLPRGGVITVTSALYFALITLFPPGLATVICLLGDSLSRQSLKLAWYKSLFNKAQLSISVAAAALVYRHVYIGELALNPVFIAAMGLCVLTFFVINTAIVNGAIALEEEVSFKSIFILNVKWTIPNFFALAPLGILISLIYNSHGAVGIFFLLLPLLASRYAFQSYIDMREMYFDTIHSLTAAIDAKDPYTAGHSQRVACYAAEIATQLSFTEDRLENLEYMAVLHDIGKVGISDAILNKPGKLTSGEYQVMQCHSVIGHEIVSKVKRLEKNASFIRHHHERWDGGGYPDRLRSEEIPLEARIITVADAFDAMTTDRPYRKARTFDEAVAELEAGAGSQFDPRMVKKFKQAIPRIREIVAQAPPPLTIAQKMEEQMEYPLSDSSTQMLAEAAVTYEQSGQTGDE